jgi:hypothetical protein
MCEPHCRHFRAFCLLLILKIFLQDCPTPVEWSRMQRQEELEGLPGGSVRRLAKGDYPNRPRFIGGPSEIEMTALLVVWPIAGQACNSLHERWKTVTLGVRVLKCVTDL